ncbi:MAG: glycosyltransferase family 2 protein [Candidatus Sungbacteria bacterium]|uniref:dolichyl-phosphate beta-glucosyltransferase n=1 Tax=Candidatus Sungiibacteriota bacterium TaxID=2750080 RepID=A0A931YD73_9BACT|nr:glycosyltransferase family 2 protein [Candidatus Sungbacteria bacterium]MBI2465738.1 glycosyltransferase family 2 protein [Candidatus Sungbacteria bacterium]
MPSDSVKLYLSLVIPAYNEEKRISRTLARVKEYLSAQNYSYEVLMVVDGAKDRTAETAENFARSWAPFKVINNKENNGKGYVVRQGMLAATGEIRVFSDADNSTDIGHLEKLLAKFQDGFDVVIGSRDYRDAVGATQAVSQSVLKRFLGDMGNLLIQFLAVPGIWDTQNGFKGFTAQAAEKIFSQTTINRWAFDVEVLALAKKFNFRIGIIPVYWKNDTQSHVKLSGYLNALWETVKIWWNLRTGKYKNI